MADVQISVGFRRESGDNPAIVLAGTVVIFDDVADEVRGRVLDID